MIYKTLNRKLNIEPHKSNHKSPARFENNQMRRGLSDTVSRRKTNNDLQNTTQINQANIFNEWTKNLT